MVGLSGSGKSTLARALENTLHEEGYLTQLLDGDNLRVGLNNNLTFSEEDRKENIRRAAETAKLFMNAGLVTICSFISPVEKVRQRAREIIGEGYTEKAILVNENKITSVDIRTLDCLHFNWSGKPIDKLKKQALDFLIQHKLKKIELSKYNFKKDELLDMIQEAEKSNLEIITTEKDYQRIKNYNFKKIKFLKVELEVHKKKQFLDQIISSL
mgnify:CR=1 FL=1